MKAPEIDDAGVGAGRALVGAPMNLSDEELRWLEEARNDPKAYQLALEEGAVTAGYVPEPVLPTEEEIGELPRWAQIAFAARCARRVLPLFVRNWPDAPREYLTRLARAV